MSLSSIAATPSPALSQLTNTGTAQTPATTSSAGPSTTNFLAQDAVTLSTDAGIAGTLSGTTAPLTYDAQTLLTSLLSRQTSASSAASSPTQSSSSSSTPADSSATSASSLDASWAQILKQNPELSGTASNDTLDQSIISTLA